MRLLSTRNCYNILLTLLGPVLIIAITLGVWHTLSTYQQVESNEQESLWSVLQLDKEIRKTRFRAREYIHGLATKASLQMAYEILWSRIPIAANSLRKDRSLDQINATHFDPVLSGLFEHIRSIEPVIMTEGTIDKTSLRTWSEALKDYETTIGLTLVHNIASSNSHYAKQTTALVIKAAAITSFFIICFILYLGYLLSALWNEHKLNQHLLNYDSLTELHSRDFIMKHLDQLCNTSRPFTVLAFDLNKLKTVNDTLGHHAGDQILQHFAKQLSATLSQKGMAGRVGGDEFLWVSTCTEQAQINQYYREFLNALKQPCPLDHQTILLTVSTGGAISSHCNNHLNCILEQADKAMYHAKQRQLKQIYWYGDQVSWVKEKRPNPIAVPLPTCVN